VPEHWMRDVAIFVVGMIAGMVVMGAAIELVAM
jgi:hypothetical protein